MVNHAQDLMSVKIFFVLPNKLIPINYVLANSFVLTLYDNNFGSVETCNTRHVYS